MADASYDAVIIGGGHQGTIIACYLQWAGLQTAIFERQHELGGGTCSDEVPLPGFCGNPCASWHRFYGHPAFSDFGLRDKGIVYNFPDTGAGMMFDDGTCVLTYPAFPVVDPITGRAQFSEENLEKTCRELARFSERDAETARILTEKWRDKWQYSFAEHYWNPPVPWGQKDAIEQLLDDPDYGIDPIYQVAPVRRIVCDLFESKELRCLSLKGFMTTGSLYPDDVPGLSVYLLVLGLILSWAQPSVLTGGTHNIPHALQRAFSEMGGKFFVHHEVEKVLIENGRAKGIRLADGTEIEAKQIVVADVGANQLISRLIGDEHFRQDTVRQVQNINYDRANLFWGPVAVNELPKYKAAAFNPDCERLERGYWGPKDPEYIIDRHVHEFYLRGIPDKIILFTSPESLWDKSRAPQGKHIIQVEQFTAPARFFSEREWLRMSQDFVKEMIRQWQWYAPNMTEDNFLGAYITTPSDTMQRNIDMLEGSWAVGAMMASQMGRFRPVPELSDYRTPIKSLYLCSGAAHFAGGIGRPCGYNCYKIIAQDLGLKKIWEEKGRSF